jgi:hypothetical protein
MNTKMVAEAGLQSHSSVEQGADAIVHLATSPEFHDTSGAFFDGERESRADREAYNTRVGQRLRTLSLELTGLSADATGESAHPSKSLTR